MMSIFIRSLFAFATVIAFVVSCSGAKADPPAGNGASAAACMGGNGEAWKALNPCPSGTPTLPPSRVNTYVYAQYLGSSANGNTSAAQAANWFHEAEGNQYTSPYGVNNVCLTSQGCQNYIYEVWVDADVNANGGSADAQLHSASSVNGGVCPNTTSNNWKTNAKESWYQHASGTAQTAANRIGALAAQPTTNPVTNPDYYIPTNVGDATTGGYQAWAQAVIKYCAVGGFALDNVGSFSDNTDLQLTADAWVFGSSFFTIGKNIGSGGGPLYADLSGSSCTLWTGTTCTRTTKLSSTTNATMEFTADNGMGGYQAALGTFLCGLRRHDGSNQPVMFNGAKSSNTTLVNFCSQIYGGINEHQVVNGGVVQTDSGIETVLNAVSGYAQNAPSKEFVSLQTSPGSSANGDPVGSGQHQRELRVSWAFMGLGFYPNFSDGAALDSSANGATANTCSSCAQGSSATVGTPAVGVWAFDFWWPNNPTTTMTAANNGGSPCGQGDLACTANGWHDLDSGSPSGLLVRKFTHCYYTPTFVFYAAGVTSADRHDTGECIFVLNLSGGSVTSSQIQTALGTDWANVNDIALPGTPAGNYFTSGAYTTGSTIVCSTTASCGDVGGTTGGIVAGQVGTGPGTIDCSTPKSTLTSLADGDAVVYTAKNTASCT